MSANSKLVSWCCVVALVCAVIVACSGRFEVAGSTVGPVMVDRWTGALWKLERGPGEVMIWQRIASAP